MKLLKISVTLALCALLLLALPAQAVVSSSNEDEIYSVPEGFEFLPAAQKNVNDLYTVIRIPGFDHSVYAYTDKSGATLFFVYGQKLDKKGMYEATLSAQQEGESYAFLLNIFGETPHKINTKDLSRPKAVKLNKETLPPGYRKTSKPGVCYFTNIFNQKEYRVLGRIEGRPDAYYPASYGKPRPGSLPIDITKDKERFKPDGGKHLKLPREYKEGYATAVLVLTTQAEWLSVLTDKPPLVIQSPK